MPLLLLPIAMLCSAFAFTLQWREQWLPEWPPQEKIWKGITLWADQVTPLQKAGWLYHWLKNLTTETIRADCEWWGKFACFVILAQQVWIEMKG